MSATIKQVANMAGVSPATVSKYLNGVRLKPHNQKAVGNAIKILDFKVNEFARNLRTNKSMTIGVLIPELNNIFSTEIISRVENTLTQYNYSTIICDYNGDENQEKNKLDFLLNKKVDALVIMPTSLRKEDIENIPIPIVFIDRQIKDDNSSYVIVDNLEAVEKATEHLISLNHSKIAVLCGNEKVYTAQKRLLGYKKALQKNNLPIIDEYILCGEYDIHTGYTLTTSLFKEVENRPTALIATNYELTMGALMALSEMLVDMPKDLSFIGFDTKDLALVLNPKLTVVLQPIEEIGKNVAKILIRKLKEPDSANEKIILETNLIVKSSTKKI